VGIAKTVLKVTRHSKVKYTFLAEKSIPIDLRPSIRGPSSGGIVNTDRQYGVEAQ